MESEDAKLLRAVGRRIGELRGARGWTQEQFSERYGVSTKYVQALEHGRQNLTLGSMARIARILGVTIGDLLHAPHSLQPNRGRPRSAKTDGGRRAEGGTPKAPTASRPPKRTAKRARSKSISRSSGGAQRRG